MEAINTPWKVFNLIGSWVTHPQARIIFALNRIAWGKGWRFYGLPIIQKHRHSTMRFGQALQLRSQKRSNPLGINHPVILATLQENACLEIGENFGMTGGSICVAERVSIGNRVALGANSTIADTDFHPLDPEIRRQSPQQAKTAPVFIEDDVFVGMNSVILKGVRIGHGSVIGAGSVVTKDVPPQVIVAGNPARIIREIRHDTIQLRWTDQRA
jgi:acetyltransferase-like isoleucine patch superfamily enzyme